MRSRLSYIRYKIIGAKNNILQDIDEYSFDLDLNLGFFGIKSNIKYIFKFFFHKISRHTILIIEPNTYHGEILPGFIKYFEDLGYSVELFLRTQHILDCPFVLLKKSHSFFTFHSK